MRTVFQCPPAIILILLVAATTSSAQEHVGEQAWKITSSIDAIETEIQNLHAQHPTLVGAWSSPEGDGGPERLYLRLHDAATTLGKARIRVLLDLAPGDEFNVQPDDEMAELAKKHFAIASAEATNATTVWTNASLPKPGDPDLENAWAAIQPAFIIHDGKFFLAQASRASDASVLLSILSGIEANRILLWQMAPLMDEIGPTPDNLTVEDVLLVRLGVRYQGITDPKIQLLEGEARAFLNEGQIQMALAATLLAETSNTNRRAYDAAFQENYDLLPDLINEYHRWSDAEPSLLLSHANELAEAIFEAAPPNATAADSNLGIITAEALARYSAVALLRGNDENQTAALADGSTSPASRNVGLPLWSTVAAFAIVTAERVRSQSLISSNGRGGSAAPRGLLRRQLRRQKESWLTRPSRGMDHKSPTRRRP